MDKTFIARVKQFAQDVPLDLQRLFAAGIFRRLGGVEKSAAVIEQKTVVDVPLRLGKPMARKVTKMDARYTAAETLKSGDMHA